MPLYLSCFRTDKTTLFPLLGFCCLECLQIQQNDDVDQQLQNTIITGYLLSHSLCT